MNGDWILGLLALQVICLYGMVFGPSEGFWTFAGVYGLFVALAAGLNAFFEDDRRYSIVVSVLAAIIAFGVLSVGAFLFFIWPVRALLVAFGVLS